METRKSRLVFSTLTCSRPSCGSRVSIIFKSAITFILLDKPEANFLSSFLTVCKTPSSRKRTAMQSSVGSICMSEAFLRMASRKTALITATTGAVSENSSNKKELSFCSPVAIYSAFFSNKVPENSLNSLSLTCIISSLFGA